MSNNNILTVFYDGACGVCSTEMSHYKTIANEGIQFVNIAASDFKAESYGKSPEEFRRELHTCDNHGQFYTGVDAFRMLWSALPPPFYPLLAIITGLPLINFASRCSYAVFARYRYLLPAKRPESCSLFPSERQD